MGEIQDGLSLIIQKHGQIHVSKISRWYEEDTRGIGFRTPVMRKTMKFIRKYEAIGYIKFDERTGMITWTKKPK